MCNLQLHPPVALFTFASMFSMNGAFRWCVPLLAAVALCGCLPANQSPMDEQKEMHFLTGKAKERELDYQGAIEAFERALEANPKNASAHFELGIRYEQENDFAAAIYHFERYLKMRPNSDYAEIVRGKISNDKIELSKTAAFAPVNKKLQEEFDKLAEENNQFRAEAEKWRAEAEQWRAYFNTQSQGRSQGAPPVAQQSTQSPATTLAATGSRPAQRSHTIKSGDTLTSIAGRYGVKVDALQAANPGLDPRKLRVGQVIHVPAN